MLKTMMLLLDDEEIQELWDELSVVSFHFISRGDSFREEFPKLMELANKLKDYLSREDEHED